MTKEQLELKLESLNLRLQEFTNEQERINEKIKEAVNTQNYGELDKLNKQMDDVYSNIQEVLKEVQDAYIDCNE